MEITLSELSRFTKDFVARLPSGALPRAYVVGLQGELGAGKTTFVQEVAKALGVHRAPTSPTFVIVQSYPIERKPFTRLLHVDAYRLSPEEPDTIGWKTYAENPENLIMVEWPERVPGGFPQLDTLLTFAVTGETTRDIVEKHGNA